MSRLGSLLVYGLKQMQSKPRKHSPMTARQFWGDTLYDTYLYYTTPKMSEAEREEFRKFMESPVEKPPVKLTTEQRLSALEAKTYGEVRKYRTVKAK